MCFHIVCLCLQCMIMPKLTCIPARQGGKWELHAIRLLTPFYSLANRLHSQGALESLKKGDPSIKHRSLSAFIEAQRSHSNVNPPNPKRAVFPGNPCSWPLKTPRALDFNKVGQPIRRSSISVRPQQGLEGVGAPSSSQSYRKSPYESYRGLDRNLMKHPKKPLAFVNHCEPAEHPQIEFGNSLLLCFGHFPCPVFLPKEYPVPWIPIWRVWGTFA